MAQTRSRRSRRRKRWSTPPTDQEIRSASPEDLIEMFTPMAHNYALTRYPKNPDAVQDTLMGLVKAAHDYDGEKGAFVPYAELWMKHYLSRGADSRNRIIHLSKKARQDLAHIIDTKEALTKRGEQATHEAIATIVGLPVKRVRELRGAPTTYLAGSLMNDDTDMSDAVDPNSHVSYAGVDNWGAIESLIDDEALLAEAKEWVDNPTRAVADLAKRIRRHYMNPTGNTEQAKSDDPLDEATQEAS